MDFSIRHAVAADWPSLGHIYRRSRPFEMPIRDNDALPSLREARDSFRGELWVAELYKQILGFVACRGPEIVWLYVDPRYFRRGVGRALLRQAVASCGALAHVHVLTTNEAARQLYLSEGFFPFEEKQIVIPGADTPVLGQLYRRIYINLQSAAPAAVYTKLAAL